MFGKVMTCLFVVVLFSCSSGEKSGSDNQPLSSHQSVGKSLSQLPHLFKDVSGKLFLSFVEVKGDSNSLYFTSLNDNGEWQTPQLITTGTNWFVNWADYPMLAVNKNNMLAHYLSKSSEDTFSYDVSVVTSNDSGIFWSEPFVLHDDGTKKEHGFVSMVPYEENFFISWLDGRNTSSEDVYAGAMTSGRPLLPPIVKNWKNGNWTVVYVIVVKQRQFLPQMAQWWFTETDRNKK